MVWNKPTRNGIVLNLRTAEKRISDESKRVRKAEIQSGKQDHDY